MAYSIFVWHSMNRHFVKTKLLLTTADPTATPAAVVAICANIPGCCGCAMVAGGAVGGCAGTVRAGDVRAGTFLVGGFAGADVLRPLSKQIITVRIIQAAGYPLDRPTPQRHWTCSCQPLETDRQIGHSTGSWWSDETARAGYAMITMTGYSQLID